VSIPTAIFLDTNILDGQNYNFGSVIFTSFVTLAKAKNLRLVLPDPTKREVQRHIRKRSLDAIRALQQAKRVAPFLAKWTHFPKLKDTTGGEWEVHRIATREWIEFLGQFTVVNLDYKAINLNHVMDWYDTAQAPFGEGKKRKEFPDALAIAILAAYALQEDTYLAVVSSDPDFKAACDRFTYLMYFPSLPALVELLLSDDNKIDQLRKVVDAFEDQLLDAVRDEVDQLSVYHSNRRYRDSLELENIDGVHLSNIRIVGIGGRECTVAFDVEVEYTVALSWLEEPERQSRYHYDEEEYHSKPEPRPRNKNVSDYMTFPGTAKLHFTEDLSRVENVVFVDLDAAELEMTEEP
jgi:hypothetical protein